MTRCFSVCRRGWGSARPFYNYAAPKSTALAKRDTGNGLYRDVKSHEAFARGDIQTVIVLAPVDVTWILLRGAGFPCRRVSWPSRRRSSRATRLTNTTALVPTEYVLPTPGRRDRDGMRPARCPSAAAPSRDSGPRPGVPRSDDRFREHALTARRVTRGRHGCGPARVPRIAPVTIVRASIRRRSASPASTATSSTSVLKRRTAPQPAGRTRRCRTHQAPGRALPRAYGHDAQGNVVRELTSRRATRFAERARRQQEGQLGTGRWCRWISPKRPRSAAQPAHRGTDRAKPGSIRRVDCRMYAGPEFTPSTRGVPRRTGLPRRAAHRRVGTLLFLGGMGRSNSRWLNNPPSVLNHDYSTGRLARRDISTAVRAEVTLERRVCRAMTPGSPAWPAYAPGTPIVTA